MSHSELLEIASEVIHEHLKVSEIEFHTHKVPQNATVSELCNAHPFCVRKTVIMTHKLIYTSVPAIPSDIFLD